MGRRTCFLIALWFGISMGYLCAQELIIEGKIRDANTHREIPGVNVFIEELQVGTVANVAGRFRLKVVRPEPDMLVTFQHIAYDTLQLPIETILSNNTIYLQERVIAVPLVEIESVDDQLEIYKDIPQTVSVIDARIFDLHGYIDAGDLLRKDHSIQVDEELSGKKTVSIRGGSPDEVIVLYNGIKMNSALDNIFDISLVDLTDVARFEVIKGSNTILYGPEAFSGVINIVPKAQQDYNVRFQQRVGSYDSGYWGLNFYQRFNKLNAAYSVKKGGSRRQYADEPEGRRLLENLSEHHTASIAYNFSETVTGAPKTFLSVMYVRSDLDYENERESETLSNFNQMVTTRFNGDIGNFRNLSVSAAYQWLDETQFLRFFDLPSDSGFLEREIDNRSIHFNADKTWRFKNFDWLIGYQFKNSRLDFLDNRILFSQEPLGIESALLERQNHGISSIGKFHFPTGRDFFRTLNLDISLRYDEVQDRQIVENSPGQEPTKLVTTAQENLLNHTWREGMVKFSTHVSGNNGRYAFNGFVNVGANVKFPSLLQQISTRELLSTDASLPALRPERNRSMEVGIDVSREVRREGGIYGWRLTANVFRNVYSNKFRSYFLPGTPIAVYDNVKTANLTGFETKQSLFLFKKKMTMEFGASRYFFSDQATFPFKHDRKYTFDIMLDQAGYSIQFHAFKEGEQVAQIRNINGGFSEVFIPSYTNIDVHFSKAFELKRVKLILNLSARNLLDDQFQLEGLALRDRRFYLTLGVQY